MVREAKNSIMFVLPRHLVWLCAALSAAAICLAQGPELQVYKVNPSNSFLGVGVKDVEKEEVAKLQLPEATGAMITLLEPAGPAAKAGLRVNDVIVEFNGQRIEGIEQFVRIMRETPVGKAVKLGIYRQGKRLNIVTMTVSRREFSKYMAPEVRVPDERQIEAPMPDLPHSITVLRSVMFGTEGEAIKGQLADFFGVKAGVLVRGVVVDSVAARAGVRPGDVIVRIDGQEVATPWEVSAFIKRRDRDVLPITIVRERREVLLTGNWISDAKGPETTSVRPAARAK